MIINNSIRDLILAQDRIALAVSGGSDSMVMLYWFIYNIPRDKFYVINVEHGIRGVESVRDSDFVREYCRLHSAPFKQFTVNAIEYASSRKLTIEQAARELRQDIYAAEAISSANVIATAHHASDQAETVFMHIARGCGVNGLSGMSALDGHIIRPLINTGKEEINEYISANNIPYINDSTNTDLKYSRNYVRHEIFPCIEKKYPAFRASLIKLSDRAKEIQELIDSLTPCVEVNNGVCELDTAKLHPVIAKELIMRAVSMLGVERDIEAKHIESLITLPSMRNNTKIDLPYSLSAYNENGKLIITSNSAEDTSEFPFGLGVFEFAGGALIISESANGGDIRSLIDADKIPQGSMIRARRRGDKIRLSYGAKSVGDYYTDTKTPVRIRGLLPLIATGSDVIALHDTAVGLAYAPDADTVNYLRIKYIPKEKYYE